MRGQAKDWWGKLTDDDLERVGGKYDKFVGLLQEKYGYTRERAAEEINRRTAEHKPNRKGQVIRQSRSCKHAQVDTASGRGTLASRLKHG